jgi:hypothetical protein
MGQMINAYKEDVKGTGFLENPCLDDSMLLKLILK